MLVMTLSLSNIVSVAAFGKAASWKGHTRKEVNLLVVVLLVAKAVVVSVSFRVDNIGLVVNNIGHGIIDADSLAAP